MQRYQKILKITFTLIAIALFLFLIDSYFVFDGKLAINYDFCKKPNLISWITPNGRAINPEKNLKSGQCYQRLKGEPVYFTVNAPRSFETAEVVLKYENPSQSIIELGLQKSAEWNFELKPLENKFIDDSEWERLDKNEIILLQKNKEFASIDEFLNNIPKDAHIAVYNYSPKYNLEIENYKPSKDVLEIDTTLRGRHEFYTYLEDEDLDFTFSWQDINWGAGKDDFIVKVYKDDVEIMSDFDMDDGNEEINGIASDLKEKRIHLTDLSGGLYKIVLEVTDDIFTRQIKTNQHLLVVKNNLFLADNEVYKETLPDLEEQSSLMHTNNDSFIFKTDHSSGFQEIKIDGALVVLDALGKNVEYAPADYELGSLKELEVSKNDVLIQGAGYFAFTADSFFDPDYGLDNLKGNSNLDKYDYLLAANYTAPEEERQYQVARQTFSLDGVPEDRKTLQFVISAPYLSEIKDDIIIKEIEVNFTKEALNFKNLWPRLKYKLGWK